MATTFCMTVSPCRPVAAFVASLGSQRRFRDVCEKRGKWFHGLENCFVGAVATKQLAGKNQQI
jgi:hypothetical protein